MVFNAIKTAFTGVAPELRRSLNNLSSSSGDIEDENSTSTSSEAEMGSSIMEHNVDLYSFYTTKITRWKGNYPRIFSVGTHGIATYNSNDAEKTNYWQWTEVYSLSPLSTSDHPNQYQLVHRKGKGTDSMRFETEHRANVLTLALLQHGAFARSHFTENIDRATAEFRGISKFRWGQDFTTTFPSVTVNCVGVEQVSPEGQKKTYFFKDISSVIELKTEGDVFAIKMKNSDRLHIFRHLERQRILSKICENSQVFIGTNINIIKFETETVQDLLDKRLGIYSSDEHVTSLCEFAVQNEKRSRILLCLSETCLIERDPATYCITSLYPLSSVFALIRCQDDSQAIIIEFTTGQSKTYFSTERDSLLASLMDGSRASGNCSVHVQSKRTPVGKRWGPLDCPVDEKVESLFLKFIHQPPPNWTFNEMVIRFNANIEYSGLLHSVTQNGLFAENKEKLILVALNAILIKDINPNEFEEFFQLVRRIVCSKTGFGAFSEMQQFREKLGSLVIAALKSNTPHDCIIYSALDVIAALMQPMHDDSDLRLEQDNKEKILNSAKFLESLLEMWTSHIRKGTGALVTMAMLDILTFALCAPYSETTLGNQFDNLLQAVAARATVLFTLFQHPSVAIVKGAGLVMKALIEEGQGTIGREMQDMALKEGALIRHLLNALFVHTSDPRLLTLRQLSRHLITLWVCQNQVAMELLRRILPSGLINFLESTDRVNLQDEDRLNTRDNLKIASGAYKAAQPNQFVKQVRHVEKFVEKQIEVALRHWRLKTAQEARSKNQFRPVALRKRRQNLKIEGNWALFYHKFNFDHALPDLLWNYNIREELKETLQNEIRLLDSDRDHIHNADICWNHADFQVQYKSLNDEIRVGGYYLRLLLEENSLDGFIIKNPKDFFGDLYHRFLLTGKPEMRGMCLQAMTIVYSRHWEEIGVFSDLKYIVLMLDKCLEKAERDRLILFIQKLVSHKENSRELVNCGGLKVLVDLLTLAHLHTSRAVIPTQSNVIEAGENMKHEDAPEWYYMCKESSEKVGPIGFQELKKMYTKRMIDVKTKCWATGLDTWKQLGSIAQLKWFLVTDKQVGVLDESKLAAVILDILIQVVSFCPAKSGDAVIRPVHKAKQILSDPANCLAHIVQLLLTFDPSIVERVATLLYLVLEENPVACRSYATGLYFFIMMYTGSNILPVSRLLHLTHLKQNTYTAQQGSSIWQRSILGNLLPEAMVAYIENHGVEKFSEIFLGEFDTPEAIWSGAMRRYLIERIALHLCDFTPRLLSNTRALYEYCAIPAVKYENLENELFCNIYYLRNLTDETRFPSWPITDPLNLLRDVLEAWKNEVEKRPPPMTVTDALKALELEDEPDWPEKVKKHYRRLAQKYHPDKNPQGRERFEEANKAYEFLCSRGASESSAPDPNRIVLILKAQSILFKRYGDVLEPYKYSGYPMLIKTIEMEVADDGLFAKETPLLPHSAEVVYHTLNCSALNVEELRREKGLELLLRTLDRCVSVLNLSSSPNDLPVLVCTHVTRCFTVATKFQLCRDKLVEMPSLASHICAMLSFKHLTKLCCIATECVAAMAVDTILQMHLLQSGVLWHLLISLFSYDFTLEEAGVEANEESNNQVLINKCAKISVIALKRMCGDGEETPKNDVIRTSLEALLLPYGAKMILTSPPETILKILNDNCCTPYLIWNNKTRTELLEYAETQLKQLRSGDITDMTYGCDFSYSVHKGELVLGSIFVRIYNSDPTFKLENTSEFINSLLKFLSTNDPTNASPDEIKCMHQAVDALSNALKHNPGLEPQCKGRFRLLTQYLMCPQFESSVLTLLTSVCANQECVADMVGMGIVPGLLVVTATAKRNAQVVVTCLNCLLMVVSHPQIVKEAIQKGAIIYLLDLFCSTSTVDPVVRQKSSETLSRLCADKLSGPRVKILLSKFLPPIYIEAMAESPPSAVQLFDSNTENPELVWNDSARYNATAAIQHMKGELYAAHRQDLSIDWRLPSESFQVDYGVCGELIIGGIYIRLYVANPTWNLRKPRDFLRDLLEFAFSPPTEQSRAALSSANRKDEQLEMVGSALSMLLSTHAHLCDSLPPMGYINKILQAIQSDKPIFKKVGLLVLRSITCSNACLEALTQLDTVQSIVNGMKQRSVDTIPVVCEALNYLFASKMSELVNQALKSGIIPIMLDLLRCGTADLGPSPSSVKANIVQALQYMSQDETHGQEVDAILSKSEVWKQYRDQKHDLFLSDKPIAGYLGSSSSSVAGYLTQGSMAKSSSIPNSPPPLIE